MGKSGFGASSSRGGFGATASMKSGSVRDKQEEEFDLEDFSEIVEKIKLDGAIEDKKRTIRKLTTTAN